MAVRAIRMLLAIADKGTDEINNTYMLAEINTTIKQPSEKYGDFLKNPHEEPAVSHFLNVVRH